MKAHSNFVMESGGSDESGEQSPVIPYPNTNFYINEHIQKIYSADAVGKEENNARTGVL